MKRVWGWPQVGVAMLCFLLASSWVAAGDPQRYLTEDCDVFVHVNFKHLFQSDMLRKVLPVLADKYGDNLVKTVGQMNPQAAQLEAVWPMIKEALRDPAKVAELLNAAGENFTDVIVVGNSQKENDFLVVMNIPPLAAPMMEMITGMIEAQAPGMLKKEQEGKKTIFLMTPPDQEEVTIAMTLLEDGVLGIAMSKERLKNAMTAKKGNPSAKLAGLIAKRQSNHTLFFAAVPKAESADAPKEMSGFVRFDKNLEVDMKMVFDESEKAQEGAKEFNDGVENFAGMLKGLAGDKDNLDALLGLVKDFKAKADGKSIRITGKIDGGQVLKLLKD